MITQPSGASWRKPAKLVAAGKVRIASREGTRAEAWVQGTAVEHRVRIEGDEDRCTCPWYSRNQGTRGECKHVLAARLALAAKLHKTAEAVFGVTNREE